MRSEVSDLEEGKQDEAGKECTCVHVRAGVCIGGQSLLFYVDWLEKGEGAALLMGHLCPDLKEG